MLRTRSICILEVATTFPWTRPRFVNQRWVPQKGRGHWLTMVIPIVNGEWLTMAIPVVNGYSLMAIKHKTSTAKLWSSFRKALGWVPWRQIGVGFAGRVPKKAVKTEGRESTAPGTSMIEPSSMHFALSKCSMWLYSSCSRLPGLLGASTRCFLHS